ncbi:RagB/SusD family nutrient uptake outer membrane protein [Pedobacter sp. WC2423]|uniref:RagB/SusD family nutrient uptake outer membrane protein n=1 Tax=Pedobacter sp. WC2423 TaxID=3234142 RepID=UPI0034655A8F
MKNIIIIILVLGLSTLGCKKLINIEAPKDQLTSNAVFSDTISATAALVNIYGQFDKRIELNLTNTFGLYTDELEITSIDPTTKEFLFSRLTASNSLNETLWGNFYFTIYSCNDLIERISNSNGISPSKAIIYVAEAKFLRAYCYLYLTNFYGRIPLVLTTDANLNRSLKQSDESVVYDQITRDLIFAQQNLPAQYQGLEKVRANKWAAAALLARVYLIMQNWANAEMESSLVINSGSYLPLDAVDQVFKSNNKESILQFWTKDGFTGLASIFVPSSLTSIPVYPVTKLLLDAFETGDLRKSLWIGESIIDQAGTVLSFPNKYKNRLASASEPEYLIGLRLSEQFLIRAESRAHLSSLDDARDDLNIIRRRAGLLNSTANTQIDLLNAIMKERRCELFCEWGSRFIDLKRTGSLDAALSYKNTWKPSAKVLPIPQNEITYNHSLIQNPNY